MEREERMGGERGGKREEKGLIYIVVGREFEYDRNSWKNPRGRNR